MSRLCLRSIKSVSRAGAGHPSALTPLGPSHGQLEDPPRADHSARLAAAVSEPLGAPGAGSAADVSPARPRLSQERAACVRVCTCSGDRCVCVCVCAHAGRGAPPSEQRGARGHRQRVTEEHQSRNSRAGPGVAHAPQRSPVGGAGRRRGSPGSSECGRCAASSALSRVAWTPVFETKGGSASGSPV